MRNKPERQRNKTMDTVLAGFRLQGTTFFEYCEANNLDRRNATRALLGTWKGKKANVLRGQIINASKAKQLMKLNAHDGNHHNGHVTD